LFPSSKPRNNKFYTEAPVGRPRHRWDDNIKMDIGGTGLKDANWTEIAQDNIHQQYSSSNSSSSSSN
jgi:hypothetical protein